ncbi:MAG: HEPN domain-containing protein [Sulfobacillus sp.]|nr:HEPN domain-containing protein [Sulfobacillus sp.]
MGIQDGRDYLILAQDDLDAAIILSRLPHQLHNACFHAQEAAEKALKAVLLAEGIHFRKVHDIEYLIDRIREVYPDFPTFGVEAAILNQYSVDARYQKRFRDHVDEDEAQNAIRYAQTIVTACQKLIEP